MPKFKRLLLSRRAYLFREHITEALWDGKVSSSTIGETRTTMCMWFGHTSVSIIFILFHSYNCLSIFPIAALFSCKILSCGRLNVYYGKESFLSHRCSLFWTTGLASDFLVRSPGFEPVAFRGGDCWHTNENRDFKLVFVGCVQTQI